MALQEGFDELALVSTLVALNRRLRPRVADVDDIHNLEAFAAVMMEALPAASAYDDAASSALDTIEEKFGGTAIRENLDQPPTRSGVGQFE